MTARPRGVDATAPRRRRDRSKESKRPGPAATPRPVRYNHAGDWEGLVEDPFACSESESESSEDEQAAARHRRMGMVRTTRNLRRQLAEQMPLLERLERECNPGPSLLLARLVEDGIWVPAGPGARPGRAGAAGSPE